MCLSRCAIASPSNVELLMEGGIRQPRSERERRRFYQAVIFIPPTSVMVPQTVSLLSPTRFRKWLAALCLLAVAAFGAGPRTLAQDLTHLSGGQDSWGFAGRQLSIPEDLAARARFCITISQNGIYVSSGAWILNPSQRYIRGDSGQMVAIQETHGNQNCIEQYDLNGNFVRSWETNASSKGSYLSGLASDSEGSIYAFDGFLGTVSKFTATGTVSGSWGALGPRTGSLQTLVRAEVFRRAT